VRVRLFYVVCAHQGPVNVDALARDKLTTALVGREWLWVQLLRRIRTEPKRIQLLLADAGLCLVAMVSLSLFLTCRFWQIGNCC
jgi:hypothetical protein